ncbi:MAG: TerC family protein [Ammonifex sp.]|jgi:YjbE family integral membrane protein|nr:MAG: TerC family protein [Ammonifex sp.]
MEALFLGALEIVLIDIVLAGDNACVIAMAVRRLSRRRRLLGIALGAAAAVFLRVSLTFVASQIILLPYLKLVGGALVIWIAVKLLKYNAVQCDNNSRGAGSLWEAVKLIMIADVVMSTDNILAIAAVAKGNLILLIFGLGLSIPFVVFGSSFLCMVMDRFPATAYLAAAVLGKIGGELMLTDPFVTHLIHPSRGVEIAAQLVCAMGVIAVAWLLSQKGRRRVRLKKWGDPWRR